jgi:hypothetical protein
LKKIHILALATFCVLSIARASLANGQDFPRQMIQLASTECQMSTLDPSFEACRNKFVNDLMKTVWVLGVALDPMYLIPMRPSEGFEEGSLLVRGVFPISDSSYKDQVIQHLKASGFREVMIWNDGTVDPFP